MIITQAVHRRRLRFGLLIGTICVAVGSALKSWGLAALSIPATPTAHLFWDVAMVMGGVGLGAYLPTSFEWGASKIPLFRRMLMHDIWVEGSWLLESAPLGQGTVSTGDETTDSLRIGVINYRFRGVNLELRPEGRHVQFTRVPAQQAKPEGAIERGGSFWKPVKPALISNSKFAYVDPSGVYTNIFKYSDGSGDGAAVGAFRTGGGNVPNQFDSFVITKSASFRQHGKKIDQKIVDTLKQRYGDANWEDKLIVHCFKYQDAWAEPANIKGLLKE